MTTRSAAQWEYLRDIPRRSQEDIASRRRMAAGYYALVGLRRHVLSFGMWWDTFSWEEQDRMMARVQEAKS